MRKASPLIVGAVALGGTLLFAPASFAQEACAYPFDPASPACSAPPAPPASVDSTGVGAASTGGAPTSVTSPSEARSLPFTGGELATLTLVGAGALVGGVVLVSAARSRRRA